MLIPLEITLYLELNPSAGGSARKAASTKVLAGATLPLMPEREASSFRKPGLLRPAFGFLGRRMGMWEGGAELR